jgi:hypothetical protein
MGTGIERVRELRRRRHRKKKLVTLKRQLDADPSKTDAIKEKIRRLTPGAEQIFQNWGIGG